MKLDEEIWLSPCNGSWGEPPRPHLKDKATHSPRCLQMLVGSWRLLPDPYQELLSNKDNHLAQGHTQFWGQPASSDWFMWIVKAILVSIKGISDGPCQLQTISRFSWCLCYSSITVHFLCPTLSSSSLISMIFPKHWPTSLLPTNIKDSFTNEESMVRGIFFIISPKSAQLICGGVRMPSANVMML